MVTVLKYQRYWARVRKRDRRRGLQTLRNVKEEPDTQIIF